MPFSQDWYDYYRRFTMDWRDYHNRSNRLQLDEPDWRIGILPMVLNPTSDNLIGLGNLLLQTHERREHRKGLGRTQIVRKNVLDHTSYRQWSPFNRRLHRWVGCFRQLLYWANLTESTTCWFHSEYLRQRKIILLARLLDQLWLGNPLGDLLRICLQTVGRSSRPRIRAYYCRRSALQSELATNATADSCLCQCSSTRCTRCLSIVTNGHSRLPMNKRIF